MHSKRLPSLSQRLRAGFLILVALNILFGVIMLFLAKLVCEFTPTIMKNNYSSIRAVSGMSKALEIIQSPADNGIPNDGLIDWVRKFETSLAEEDLSATEPGEDQIAQKIHGIWELIKKNPLHVSTENYMKMKQLLDELVTLNQNSMFATTKKSKVFENHILLLGITFLLSTTLFAVFFSDKIAKKLSSPLKKMTDALQQHPFPGDSLSLPRSTTYEIDALSWELSNLWQHLSELKKIDVEELNNQKEKLKTILTCVEDAILVVDTKNSVVHINHGMEEILGVTRKKILGQPWNKLAVATKNYLLLREELAPRQFENYRIEFLVGEQQRIFEIRSRSIQTDMGSAGRVFLLHDITEKSQRDRLKKEFIGVLSHELKTPLQSLSTAIELITQEKKNLTKDKQFLLETMNEDVARIKSIANDFFHVSLGEIHSLRLNLEMISLGKIIQDWLKPFQIVAAGKNINLAFVDQTEGQSLVKIDRVKFPWIVSNLVSNALRMTPEEGRVDISVNEAGGHICLRVIDNGPGIPDELKEKIFLPYFQGPSKETLSSMGSLGLGLTVAREVVSAHGGKIKYYPNQPKGAIFEVRLPKAYFEDGVSIL